MKHRWVLFVFVRGTHLNSSKECQWLRPGLFVCVCSSDKSLTEPYLSVSPHSTASRYAPSDVTAALSPSRQTDERCSKHTIQSADSISLLLKHRLTAGQSDYWVKWIVTSGFRKRRVDFTHSRRALYPDANRPSRSTPACRHQHESQNSDLKDKHSRMAAYLEVRGTSAPCCCF